MVGNLTAYNYAKSFHMIKPSCLLKVIINKMYSNNAAAYLCDSAIVCKTNAPYLCPNGFRLREI